MNKGKTLAKLQRERKKMEEKIASLEREEREKAADEAIVKYLKGLDETAPKEVEPYLEIYVQAQAVIARTYKKMKRDIRERFKNDTNKQTLPEFFRKLFLIYEEPVMLAERVSVAENVKKDDNSGDGGVGQKVPEKVGGVAGKLPLPKDVGLE